MLEITMSFAMILSAAVGVALFVGLWRGLSRLQSPVGMRAAVWLALAASWTAWLVVIRWLALNGAFTFRTFVPGGSHIIPTQLAVLVPPLLAAGACFALSRWIGPFLDSIPPSWLIGIQALRVFGASFLVGWAHGTVPAVFAWEAGTFDIIVGVLALPVARLASSGTRTGYRMAVAWNWLGLADFAIALVISMLLRRAPDAMGVGDPSRVRIGSYPLVIIPAFLVANAIIWHGLSLWQLQRRRQRHSVPVPQLATTQA